MHNFSTILTDEIEVTVYFDFEPEEKQTHDCPGCPAELIINTVLIDDNENKDVLYVLNDLSIEALEKEAEQYLLDQISDPNEPD